MLETITSLSLAFLDDKLDEKLKELPTKPMDIMVIGVKKDGKPKRKLLGNPGDVIEESSG
jgi:platelet-activating factor acetylhydrolase